MKVRCRSTGWDRELARGTPLAQPGWRRLDPSDTRLQDEAAFNDKFVLLGLAPLYLSDRECEVVLERFLRSNTWCIPHKQVDAISTPGHAHRLEDLTVTRDAIPAIDSLELVVAGQ
jgi:hypothetical protein